MEKKYKWGIIGPGKIAQKFAAAIALVPNAVLHAVASRDSERAAKFAHAHGATHFYNSYEALANDAEIDAVYIATPHTFHHAHVLLCLQQKKAVLCEKPMSVNFSSTAEMVRVARENNVFLMEAMWSRFLPIIEKTLQLVKEGEVGDLKYISADFGFRAAFDPGSRLYNLSLGGGSLLDVGIYPLFLVLMLLGRPDEVKAFSQLAPTGADESTNAILYYNQGAMGHIFSSVGAPTPITAQITGTTGTIFLDRPWYKGSEIRIRKNDTITDTISLPYGDNGFEFQVREVQECLDKGLTESTKMPLAFSLLLSEILGDICSQTNLKYSIQQNG